MAQLRAGELEYLRYVFNVLVSDPAKIAKRYENYSGKKPPKKYDAKDQEQRTGR